MLRDYIEEIVATLTEQLQKFIDRVVEILYGNDEKNVRVSCNVGRWLGESIAAIRISPKD